MGYKTEEEKRLNKDEQQYNVIGSEVLPQDNGYEFNEELKHDKNGEDNRVNLNSALPTRMSLQQILYKVLL
jgi:hypothetical protein